MALSSRNSLLSKIDLKTSGIIANKLFKLKRSLHKKNGIDNISPKKTEELIQKLKQKLINKFNIKIEYLECRNLKNLSKLFISYYLNEVRLIDNF
jgi:pantoate--beta-alanine ligase